jgi:hypothetical protein
MYEFDDSAAAIGVFLLTIFMVLIFYIATPAHSQEAPAGPPCAPWRDIHSMLEKQFGETTTAGGIIGEEFMELMTSREGTFTILMRRLDGTACIVAGGKGFALADRSKMKGPGL